MKIIGFKELRGCGNCSESLFSNISVKEYENKDKILNYLKNGNIIYVTTALLHDIFTGDSISYEDYVMTDNEYTWTNELVYYVEKYNAKLPDDFINHILTKQNIR